MGFKKAATRLPQADQNQHHNHNISHIIKINQISCHRMVFARSPEIQTSPCHNTREVGHNNILFQHQRRAATFQLNYLVDLNLPVKGQVLM
jgi:hypothetical protein